MSNNIYDILKKMQSLETPKANLTEGKKAKPDFLDMDKDGDTTEPMKKAAKAKSKGAVAEAVAQVEQQLNEKYMGFKEATRLAMRMSPGGDMKRHDKDSTAPGAQQHRDATAKAAKAFRSAGGKMGDGDEVGRNAMAQPSRNDKGNAALGDKQLTRYSKTNENSFDPRSEVLSVMQEIYNGAVSGEDMIDTLATKFNDYFDDVRRSKDKPLRKAYSYMMNNGQEAEGDPEMMAQIAKQAMDMLSDQQLAEKEGHGESDPLKNRADYAKHGTGQVYKKTYPGDKVGMSKSDAYNIKRSGPKGNLPESMTDEDMLSPKQKKFAKLAPPPDKITYADKIAGAKKTNEGFPTVADAEKRMREKEGKTAHGKKTTTAAGTRHERDYDAVDKGADVDMTPKGRGRPKKDRFA